VRNGNHEVRTAKCERGIAGCITAGAWRSLRLLLVLLCLQFAGCPKRAQLAPPSNAKVGLQQALDALEAAKYGEAEERLTFVIFNFPGTREASDAQYYLAETYFRSRDYVQAQTEYDFYLRSFPNGRFQEEANYKLGLSHFYSAPSSGRDQTSTKKAREILQEFLVLYPDSELRGSVESALADIERKLAERDFNTAALYFKAGVFKSALTYYQYLLGKLPLERWTGQERLRLGVCYLETGQVDEARTVFESILGDAFEEGIQDEARARLAQLAGNMPQPE